jgi:signal transduction histidine kinase
MLEGELSTRPGQHRYWTVSYMPVRGEDGTIRAVGAVIMETTAQKRAEQALIQSEKLAAVGRLASSISHEINNPLEAITNLLYLAQHTEGLPQEAADALILAEKELMRVSQIASQTLRFHRQATKPTWVTAVDLLKPVVALYQGRLTNSNLRLVEEHRSAEPVQCFENDIRQVLNNLIGNAIDAMKNVGGRVLIRSREATDWKTGRRGLRITVADSGSGMSETTRRSIFTAFYTTKEINGTGLGLWISFGIVGKHEGVLRFYSSDRPGHSGTVFSLFLPRYG